MTYIDYIGAFALVMFGVFAGGPVWLLLFKVADSNEKRWEREREQMRSEAASWRPRRQQWRVVDGVCKRLGVRQ